MHERKRSLGFDQRFFDTEGLGQYLCVGRNTAIKLGEEAGAKVKIGRLVRWDKTKIDEYMNGLVC